MATDETTESGGTRDSERRRVHLPLAAPAKHQGGAPAPTAAARNTLERVLARLLRGIVRRAARQTLQGRRISRSDPAAGRFLGPDVDVFLADMWRRVAAILASSSYVGAPTLGNRCNVFLAVLTVAAYHALIAAGIERAYACELFADVGWKVYERMIRIPLSFGRVVTRDRQRRIDVVLRSLMRFPFSAPGRPGYEVTTRSINGCLHTDWSCCAPFGFVERYVAENGDRGEADAFYQSWCLYDWPAADLLAGAGPFERGHYARRHTLSRGDGVCDMRWSAAALDERGRR